MKPKKMRYTKALYEEMVRRAEVAEERLRQEVFVRERDWEPRPKSQAHEAGWYGASLLDACLGGETWRERFLKERVVTESWQLRTKLAESAHRAMAEALREMGGGASSAAVICEWAGRGMQDKPTTGDLLVDK
jgi:hypothetical protein